MLGMDILSGYCGGIKENVSSKLGYLNKSVPDLTHLIRCDVPAEKKISKRKRTVTDETPSWFRVRPTRRVNYKYNSESSDSDEEYKPTPKPQVRYRNNVDTEHDIDELDNAERRLGLNKRPNQYGSIEGVVVGQWWKTRLECSFSGVHRPTVAGIHAGPEGAYSVALSGGYEGDFDAGDEFTYTGEGGRDLKGTKANPKNLRTAPQSKDQELTKGNLALHRNFENRLPVRVIRGFKLHGDFAPEDGYRYDGLYQVVKCWSCIGSAGFLIYKFHFVRYPDQLPLVDSVDNMLLFSSIKKELSRRLELRKNHSDSSSDESSDKDMVDSGCLPSENGKVNPRLFYIENTDSIDMFYKGKFLGWNKVENFEESAKKFRDILSVLEGETNVDVEVDDEEMEPDGSFLGWKASNVGDENVKEFSNVIETLKDYIKDDDKVRDKSICEDSSDDIKLFLASTPMTERLNRRKPSVPLKVVRFSLEKAECLTSLMAG